MIRRPPRSPLFPYTTLSRPPRREVASRAADDDHAAARHVLAAVVADALDDRVGAAVAHGEPLAGHAPHVGLAARRAVERDVADDDVGLGHEGRAAGRVDDETSARQTLAPVVVGVALERERDAAGEERAEGLAGGAREMKLDSVVGQAGGAHP